MKMALSMEIDACRMMVYVHALRAILDTNVYSVSYLSNKIVYQNLIMM